MDNLSRTLEDFDLAHILDNSVDGRTPALRCVMDNSAPRLWLARPAESQVCMTVGAQAVTPDRLHGDTAVFPPYFSARVWGYPVRPDGIGPSDATVTPTEPLARLPRPRAARPTGVVPTPTLAMKACGA